MHDIKPDFHFALPTSIFPHINRENQLEVKLWLMRLKNSQEKLIENMKLFDQCKSDIEAFSQNMHRELMELTTQTLATLDALREKIALEIEQAVQETSENACNSGYQPGTYMAGLVWNHSCYQSSDPIRVFAYNLQTEVSVQDWWKVDLKEVGSYQSQAGNEEMMIQIAQIEAAETSENVGLQEIQTPLVQVTPSFMRYLDIKTRTWTQKVSLQQKIEVDADSSWVALEDGGVFVCRGQLVHVVSGEGAVVCRTDMRQTRWFPGVLAHHRTVFIFGGRVQSGYSNC